MSKIEVECPCCNNRLTVDAKTGDVLAERRAKPDLAKTFDDAVSNVRGGANRREEAFEKARDRTKRLEDLLEKKFEEARKKAAEDPSKKPFNPMDVD
jgi:hypothetical protein